MNQKPSASQKVPARLPRPNPELVAQQHRRQKLQLLNCQLHLREISNNPMTDFFYKIHSRLGIRPFPFRLKFIRVLFETEKYFNYFLQDRTQLYITGFTLFFS